MRAKRSETSGLIGMGSSMGASYVVSGRSVDSLCASVEGYLLFSYIAETAINVTSTQGGHTMRQLLLGLLFLSACHHTAVIEPTTTPWVVDATKTGPSEAP